MQWSAEKKITVGFGLALLLLGFISVVSYRSTTNLVKTASWVAHTHEVLAELDDVPLQLARAEAAQRSYLLTGDERDLGLYRTAAAAMRQEIEDLRKLTVDNPVQQRLSTLEFRTQEKFAALQWTIDLWRSQGPKAAVQDVLADKSKKATDDIQALLHAMEAEERGLLHQRLVTAETSAHNTLTIIVSGNLLAITIVALANLIVHRDLAKRGRAEGALRKSEERYRSLFETAKDGIATFAVDGTITSVNSGLEVMLHWPREDLISQHYRKIATPASVARWEERLRRALAVERLPSVYEAELVRKDGTVVPVEVRASFLRNENGNPTEILAIHRDISMREGTVLKNINANESRSCTA